MLKIINKLSVETVNYNIWLRLGLEIGFGYW